MRGRQKVIFLYVYGETDDAVACTVRQLANELDEFKTEVIGLPLRLVRYEQRAPAVFSKVVRIANQFVYMIWALIRVCTSSSDVVITVDAPTGIGFVGRLAEYRALGGATHIAWVMDLYRLGSRSSGGIGAAAGRIRRYIELSALLHASHVVTIGFCMAAQIERLTERPADVIPLWHTKVQATSADVRSMRDRMLSVSDSKLLLYAGSAREIHPLGGLVGALTGQDRSWTLAIVGAGAEFERLKKANLPPNVVLFNPVPHSEVDALLCAADVSVVSLAESALGTCVPSKAYAGMAAAKPILFLGPRDSQTSADIAAAECGCTSRTDSQAQIKQALATIEADLVRMSNNAHAFYCGQRTVAIQAREWKNYIDTVLVPMVCR